MEDKADNFLRDHSSLGREVVADVINQLAKEAEEEKESVLYATNVDDARYRSKSQPHVRKIAYPKIGTASEISVPGGFRRQFLGIPSSENDLMRKIKRNASEILDLLGEDVRSLFTQSMYEGEDYPINDEAPLLSRERQGGGNSVLRTLITMMKAMVGTFILYLPHLFHVGGLLFSTVVLSFAAAMTAYNMLLLIECKTTRTKTYGDIAFRAIGRKGKHLIETAIVLTQFAFCCTYFIYVSRTINEVFNSIGSQNPALRMLTRRDALYILQVVLYIPMVWIKKIKHFAVTTTIANTCLITGLLTIVSCNIDALVHDGPQEIIPFVNPNGVLLYMGSIVTCFEGIALVLPIYEAMQEKDKFHVVIKSMMIFLAIFYVLFSVSGYLAYGIGVEIFVTSNIPTGRVVGKLVKIFYSVAIIFTFPLMLFPALQILEGHFFRWISPSEKLSLIASRFFRAIVVVVCLLVAVGVGNQYDNFVAVVGGTCAVPLALVFPVWFHLMLKGNTVTRFIKVLEISMLAIGVVSMVLCTSYAIVTWKT